VASVAVTLEAPADVIDAVSFAVGVVVGFCNLVADGEPSRDLVDQVEPLIKRKRRLLLHCVVNDRRGK
jgi:hypothetical protein